MHNSTAGAIAIAASLTVGGIVAATVDDHDKPLTPEQHRPNDVAWGGSGGSLLGPAPKVTSMACAGNAVSVDVEADLVGISQAGGSDCVVAFGESKAATGARQTICATSGVLSIADQANVVVTGGTIRIGVNDCTTFAYSTTGHWIPDGHVQWDMTLCANCRVNRTVSSDTTATMQDDIIRVIRPGLTLTNAVTFPTCDASLNGKTWEIVPEGAGLGVVQLVAGIGNTIRSLTTLNILGTSATTLTCNGAGEFIARP